MTSGRSGLRREDVTRNTHRAIGRPTRAVARVLMALLALSLVPPASATTGPEPRLDVVLESTQHWPGTNDVLLSVFDESGRSLAEEGLPVELEFVGPHGSRLRARPAIERFATYGRWLYRARAPLPEIGRWGVDVSADIDGVAQVGSATVEVSPDVGTPALGSSVPGGDTPTMRDARSLMHHISSDPEPLTAFYTWSLDEALAHQQPTVFVLDSYAFRPNAACGGALGILHEVFIDYPGLTVIHAEPWNMTHGSEGGMLQLDPPGGPAVLTEYARAWGIDEPPWVFVIDRDGRLHAKFSGIIGSDELRAAISSVTEWRPVGG
jgi:hypothetical protein